MVILAVALTERGIGKHTPVLDELAGRGRVRRLRPVLPAVTCSVQASMLTGLPVRDHGVVGNGWYNRELSEVQFWKQSAALVSGERVWDVAAKINPAVRCAQMFWWFNMYSSAAYSVTPRPIYAADGRKIPDCYSQPADLRDELQGRFGAFPLFKFWGPGASIESTRWIADATMFVRERHNPLLTLVYLPHLDYALQKFGPDSPEARRAETELDAEIGRLRAHNRERGVATMVVSEYGIEPVSTPVHLNRALREAGLVAVRVEQGGELLDAGASRAFAAADHQVAHVYVRDASDLRRVGDLLRSLAGVERVLDRDGQRELAIDHPRAGEFVVVAEAGCWFTYSYWLDDARAPDFARTVDIFRKPGYDPCELFIDPKILLPKARLAGKLLRKKLGFRTVMDVIPLDAGLVKGSHGRVETAEGRGPIIVTEDAVDGPGELACESVKDEVLASLFGRA
jgi:predicted AlkP superfamily pyrophosphatase or phosphodiesterase